MKYICRSGLIMEKICGVRLRISTMEAYEYCPNIIQLALPAAMLWKMLSKNKTKEEIQKMFSIMTGKTDSEVQIIVDDVLNSFVKSGALIMEEDE